MYERPGAAVDSGGVSAKLAQVWIDPVTSQNQPDPLSGNNQALYDSRAAQLLQNHLKEGMNPYGRPDNAAYHLEVELEQFSRATATLSDQQVSREDLELVAKYKLNDLKGNTVLSDSSRVVTSYDVVQQPFSDLSAKNDALQRGTQELALQIQTRLSVFLGK
jgi:LPS-assembly lipoprotein